MTITVSPGCGTAQGNSFASAPATIQLCTDGTSGQPVVNTGAQFVWNCGSSSCFATNTGGGACLPDGDTGIVDTLVIPTCGGPVSICVGPYAGGGPAVGGVVSSTGGPNGFCNWGANSWAVVAAYTHAPTNCCSSGLPPGQGPVVSNGIVCTVNELMSHFVCP